MRTDYFQKATSFEEREGKFLEFLLPTIEPIISNFGIGSMSFETTKCSCILTYYKNERKLQFILYWCDEKGSIFYCHILKVSEVVRIPYVLNMPPKKYFHSLEELEIEVALWVEFLKLELPNHFSLESSIKNNPTNKLKIEIKIEFIKNYVSMLSPMLLILWNDYYIGGTKYITDKEIVYNLSTNNPVSVDIKLVLVNYLEEDCHLNCCLEYNNFKELYVSNFIDSKKPIQYIYNFETLKYEINRCLLFLKNELIVIPNMYKAPIQISKQ